MKRCKWLGAVIIEYNRDDSMERFRGMVATELERNANKLIKGKVEAFQFLLEKTGCVQTSIDSLVDKGNVFVLRLLASPLMKDAQSRFSCLHYDNAAFDDVPVELVDVHLNMHLADEFENGDVHLIVEKLLAEYIQPIVTGWLPKNEAP